MNIGHSVDLFPIVDLLSSQSRKRTNRCLPTMGLGAAEGPISPFSLLCQYENIVCYESSKTMTILIFFTLMNGR